MILLTHHSSILLCVAPSDFRKQIDGFASLCRHSLQQDPRDGTIFVFINKSHTMIRALTYDGTGFWIMTKRLSRGKFTGWPTSQETISPASARQLRVLIGNGSFSAVPEEAEPAQDLSASPLASSHPAATLYPNTAASTTIRRPAP